jgi:hypothetical protein
MRVSELTRRNILDYLLLREYPFHGRLDLISFLKRIWSLSSMPSTDDRFENAEGDIHQHMVNNWDWEYDYLLNTYLNLPECNDETFVKFLEECVHPMVLRDEEQREKTVAAFNKELEYDGLRLEATKQFHGRPLYEVVKLGQATRGTNSEEEYEVVLSFAGEDRPYVEAVAEYLRGIGIKVFYDKYEESTLWGKDLAEHLDKVYRGSARYCVMFISRHYAEKVWTTHERRSALARALEEKTEYVLPARFDDTEIPGLRPTIGYVNLSVKSPEQLGELILEKLGKRR